MDILVANMITFFQYGLTIRHVIIFPYVTFGMPHTRFLIQIPPNMVPSHTSNSLQYDFQYGMLQYNNKYHIGNSNTFKKSYWKFLCIQKKFSKQNKRVVKEAI